MLTLERLANSHITFQFIRTNSQAMRVEAWEHNLFINIVLPSFIISIYNNNLPLYKNNHRKYEKYQTYLD